MKQAKQLVHHPKSLDPALGEGNVIMSPPVSPMKLKCLKEIPRALEQVSGQLLACCSVLPLVKIMRLFGEE